MHCFGHIHESNGAVIVNWGTSEELGRHVAAQQGPLIQNVFPESINPAIVHGEGTLMVNAAVMDGKN